MRKLKHDCRRIICLLLLGICLPALCSVSAAYAEETRIKGSFTTLDHTVIWEYGYDDDFFLKPSDQYNHEFARLSLGMALAAFRHNEQPDAQDDNLIDFLQSIGFSRIETGTYHMNPTSDSVGYGMAVKKIGDTTVLACAVCGGNYGKEWASNLTVGDYVRSQGFQDSSLKVQEAIADYLERNIDSGSVKLWIAGFSRGGAVANITAADCTESGIFEDVYAYTFATPRTTREPLSYPNIFNIIQKEDMVPKVPLADWGYERFGRDLLLVSQETDSNCADIMKKAEELYRNMIGSEMVTNSEINYQLRILIDYLLMLLPNSAAYTVHLQPLLVDIMKNADDDETMEALQVLLQALNQYSTDDPAVGQELKAMREYLGTLIGVYLLQGKLEKLPANMWDPEMGTGTLFNAHFPFEYLAMMFASDDPGELFTENTEYVRLMIYGNVDISISDGNQVLKKIFSDGTEQVDGDADSYDFLKADCYEDKIVITLPEDRSYDIIIESRSELPQTITYTGLLISGHTVRAKMDDSYSYIMGKGEAAVIRTSVNGRAIEPSSSDHTDISLFTEPFYSPTTAMRLENNSVAHLTISGLVNRLLLLIVLLLVQMIASIVLMIIRRKKHRKRNATVAFIWHGIIVFLFVLLEVAMWYFVPILTIAKMIPGALAFIAIAIYSMKGCLEGRGSWKTFWILVAVLAAYVILESLLIGDFTVLKGILLIIAYMGFMTAGFVLLWHRKTEA